MCLFTNHSRFSLIVTSVPLKLYINECWEDMVVKPQQWNLNPSKYLEVTHLVETAWNYKISKHLKPYVI